MWDEFRINKYVRPNIKELLYPGNNNEDRHPQSNQNHHQDNHQKHTNETTSRNNHEFHAVPSSSVIDLIQMKAMKMKVRIRNHIYNATVNTSRRVTAVNLQVGQFIVGNNPRLYDVLNSLMEVDGKTEDVPFIVVPEQGEKMIIGSQFLEIFGLTLNISWKAPVHQRVGQRGGSRSGRSLHHRSNQYHGNRRQSYSQKYEQQHDDNSECLQIDLNPAERSLVEFD